MTETHPWIKHLEKRLETDDPQTLDDRAIGEFSLYTPVDRADILDRFDAALADAEDGVSLRRKAQLLDFSRKLKFANNALHRAGR